MQYLGLIMHFEVWNTIHLDYSELNRVCQLLLTPLHCITCKYRNKWCALLWELLNRSARLTLLSMLIKPTSIRTFLVKSYCITPLSETTRTLYVLFYTYNIKKDNNKLLHKLRHLRKAYMSECVHIIFILFY